MPALGLLLLAGCATERPAGDEAVTEIRVINRVDFWFLQPGARIVFADGVEWPITGREHVLIKTNLLWDVYQARVRCDELRE